MNKETKDMLTTIDTTPSATTLDKNAEMTLSPNNELVNDGTSFAIGDLFISLCIALAVGYITIKLKR